VLVDLINGSAQRMRSYRGDIFDGLNPADYFAGRWDVFIRAMALPGAAPKDSFTREPTPI
tara:strand:+ start:17837 stop:18016 length:180 start_codon:yes stop_codon:yes gene_type:complete